MGICGRAQMSGEASIEEPEPIHNVPDSSDSVLEFQVHGILANSEDVSAIQQESSQSRENSLSRLYKTDSLVGHRTEAEDLKLDRLGSSEQESSESKENSLARLHKTDSPIGNPTEVEDLKLDLLESSEARSPRLPALEAAKSAPNLLEQPCKEPSYCKRSSDPRESPSSARQEALKDDDDESLVLVQSSVRKRARSECHSKEERKKWTPSDKDKKKYTNWTPRYSGYASEHTKRDVMPWDKIYTPSNIIATSYSPRRRTQSVGVQSTRTRGKSARKHSNIGWTPRDEDKKKYTNRTPRYSGYASQRTKRDVMPWDKIYTPSNIIATSNSPRRRTQSVPAQSTRTRGKSAWKRVNVVH